MDYSLEERCIGTWIDGKPLYRKMIDFGNLSNNTGKKVNHGITNVSHIHINIGESYFYMTTRRYEFYSFIYNEFIENVYVSNTFINIDSTRDASSYKALVCVEYTKATDI